MFFFSFFAALNPDPRYPPMLDPKDQALLLDPGSSAPDYGQHHGHGHHGPGTPPMPANVSWLRKTEYISRDSSAPSHRPAAADMFVISSLMIVIFSLISYIFLQNELPE
jgi:RNA polymerase II-associated factor 1